MMMISELKFPDIVSFEDPPAITRRKWGDNDIWEGIKMYPEELQANFEILRTATHEYLIMGFTATFFNTFRFTHRFMRLFTHHLAKLEDLEKSFTLAKGLREEIGLLWASYKIQEYYKQNLRPPPCDEPSLTSIYHCSKTGAFKKHGIKTWKELLHEVLKGYQLIELERNTIQGKAGLDRACKHLQKTFDDMGRIPQVLDPGIKLIKHAIYRGAWIEFGIKTWPDLLRYVFGLDKIPYRRWKGLDGLKRAQKLLGETAQQKFPDFPTKSDIPYNFSNVIRNNYWVEFGINNVDDLIKSVWGNNFTPKTVWHGECGFLEAQNQLKAFYSKNHRLPTCKNFPVISQNCFLKFWVKFEITSWNDLLLKLFGKANHIHKKWQGQAGLNLAQKLVLEYYRDHKKWPTTSIRQFRNICATISKQKWIQFGIKSWKDLLHSIIDK
jgi:hypothetical protein